MDTEIVEKWSDLTGLVGKFELGNWIFRGVRNGSYELMPKIGRPDARKDDRDKPREFEPHREKTLFEEYKRMARPLVENAPDPNKAIEWLAIGQHHGLPTRLLDWTESVLVAAFFACEVGFAEAPVTGEGTTTDIGTTSCKTRDLPAIYGVNGIEHYEEKNDPLASSKKVTLYRPPHISPRIVAQKAVFTVHGTPNVVFAHPNLRKWKIMKPLQMKMLLDRAGVNRASLFPGLDGTAMHLGWQYKRDRLPNDKI